MSETGNFPVDRRRIASNISFFALSVYVIHRISSGLTPSSSSLITFADKVVVLPVPGFETTIASSSVSTMAFCSSVKFETTIAFSSVTTMAFCSSVNSIEVGLESVMTLVVLTI